MSDDDFDDLDYKPGFRLPGFVLPVLTAFVATSVGFVLGGAMIWLLKPDPDPIKQIVEMPRELTEAEIQAVCAPFIEEATNRVEEAEQKVRGLEAQVVAKKKHVEELEAEMKRRAQRGSALVRQLEAAKAELLTLEQRLEQAVEEKEMVIAELKKTKEELEEQKIATDVAKEDALTYKWRDFIGNAQLAICERGNRRRMGRCRETIDEVLGPALREKFNHCVRSGQAIPSVREIGKDEELPQFAQFLDQDDRVTKDWYILLCDPTLPEADGTVADPEPREPDDGLFGDFDDLPEGFEDLDLDE